MSSPDRGQIRVLYVDDDRALAKAAAEALELERDRLVVSTATSASAALDRLDATVDCVVSDYDMAGQDGLELLEMVREHDSDLPFVLFTGAGGEAVASEAIAAGVTDYVRKQPAQDQYAVLANRIERAVEAYRAERTLAERDRQLSTLISNIPGMVYRCRNEPDWPMEFVSEGCADLTGYDPGQLESGAVVWGEEILHPDDRDQMWDVVQDAIRDGDPFEVTYRILTADGETRWVWEQGRGVYETEQGRRLTGDEAVDSDATLVALEGFISDITEQRRARRQRRQYETVVESMDEGAFVLDADGRFEFVNDSLAADSPFDKSDLLGADADVIGEQADTDDHIGFEALLDRLATSDQGHADLELERQVDDGDRTYSLRLTTVGEEPDDGIVGVARDVTDRQAREAELERYGTIVEAVGDPVYTLDADGYFTFANESFRSQLGYDPEDLVGAHVSRIMSEDDVERGEGLIADLLGDPSRTNGTFEMDVVDADGEAVAAENHIALLPTDEDEGFRGTAGVIRDISARKERERRLEQFATVVSHDLRNPLTVVEGRVATARDRGELEHLDTALDALDRVNALIDDLLELAHQGQSVGETEPVPLDDAARTAWDHVDAEAVTLSLADDLGTAPADPDRLRQLFENLFRNAVEHAGAGTTVTVAETDGGFAVADDGPGIPSADRDSVFEYGYAGPEGGTGFGLAIVHDIAQAHDWSVQVTESESGGARFEFGT